MCVSVSVLCEKLLFYMKAVHLEPNLATKTLIALLSLSHTHTHSSGKDSYGQKLRECAAGHGVRVAYQEDETTPTG